jgi:hypothetical protein
MSSKQVIARNLAAAFLTGPWSLDGLVRQGALACGKRERWLPPLARRVLAAFSDRPADGDPRALAAFIGADKGFGRAWANHCYRETSPLRQVFWVVPTMAPMAWQVPALPTAAALAGWLGVGLAELDWFADCRGRGAQVPEGPLRHYTYRWLAKRRGKARLVELPKARLKAIQRQILRDLLDHIPAHEQAHGFRRGRSIATYVKPHTGRAFVLHMDLRNFFPSIRSSRVHALLRTAGYPPGVARLLTGLCTNSVPWEVLRAAPPNDRNADRGEDWSAYHVRHLPQGAPTSPAVANLCTYRLDCRLAALAQTLGAHYTRYADDLAFSGDEQLERCARRLHVLVCRVALEEGFEVNTRKTRFLRQAVRQQIAGIVLNAHPNVRRSEYDLLKAILYNCVRHGPESQNREGHPDFQAHLRGRIAYIAMLNAARGQRLLAWFDKIHWGS